MRWWVNRTQFNSAAHWRRESARSISSPIQSANARSGSTPCTKPCTNKETHRKEVAYLHRANSCVKGLRRRPSRLRRRDRRRLRRKTSPTLQIFASKCRATLRRALSRSHNHGQHRERHMSPFQRSRSRIHPQLRAHNPSPRRLPLPDQSTTPTRTRPRQICPIGPRITHQRESRTTSTQKPVSPRGIRLVDPPALL